MQCETTSAELNIDTICRICLEEKKDAVSIFSDMEQEIGSEKKNVIVSDIIMQLSDMKINADDGLPQIICEKCVATAFICINFQLKCNHSAYILSQNTKQNLITSFSFKEEDRSVQLCESPLNNCEETEEGFAKVNGISLGNRIQVDLIDSPYQEVDGLKTEDGEEDTVNTTTSGNTDDKEYEDCNIDFPGEVHSCDICNKMYKYKASLVLHMKKHSLTSQYTCKLCGISFRDYSNLFYHNRVHSSKQPHVCKICGKKYKRSTTLTAHMRVHTGHRPYLCSICGKDFRQAPDLNYHMRTHTKEKRYMCNICGKTMAMQCHLVLHMRTHTGERPFKCGNCSKTFPSSTSLKRHSITHTDLKPYKCEVCDKSFNRMSTLKVHSKIHSDERAYSCPVCNKRFIQAHTMKSHILTHSASNTLN